MTKVVEIIIYRSIRLFLQPSQLSYNSKPPLPFPIPLPTPTPSTLVFFIVFQTLTQSKQTTRNNPSNKLPAHTLLIPTPLYPKSFKKHPSKTHPLLFSPPSRHSCFLPESKHIHAHSPNPHFPPNSPCSPATTHAVDSGVR